MTTPERGGFADTAFWVALVFNQDTYHAAAQQLSLSLECRIITTRAVLLETANSLSRPPTRKRIIELINHIAKRNDIDVLDLSDALWNEGWTLREGNSCVPFFTSAETPFG